MPFDNSQKEKIKNHIPTISKNCNVFLQVFDANMGDKDEKKAIFLIELIDAMEVDLAESKTILQTQIP